MAQPLLAVVELVPPAVADGQVQPAVERGLHPRGAARLQRPQRVVQPDVAAPVQVAGHRHVVVGQERRSGAGSPGRRRTAPSAGSAPCRRRRPGGLAGDDQLHRPVRVEQHGAQPVRVAQHQRQPLVGGHAAGEPDGEDVRVEDVRRSSRAPARTRRAAATPRGPAGAPRRPAGRAACVRSSHSVERPTARRPVVRARPPARGWRRAARTARGPSQVRPCTPLVTDPIGTSSASKPRPQVANMPRDTAPCSLRHAVGALGQPQAHVRHVEHARVVLGAEGEDAVGRHARQQRRPRRRRRSSAGPGPAGTGRCRRAPGCAW